MRKRLIWIAPLAILAKRSPGAIVPLPTATGTLRFIVVPSPSEPTSL